MSRLEIRLLGGFEAKLTGKPVQRFESQKVRALLAYLALHRGQELNRDQLAGMFWPERPDEVARRNLRQALYNIRTALGGDDGSAPPLAADQHRVQLHPDLECWVDVLEFKNGVRLGLGEDGPDPLRLSEATRLYKGDLLAGFFLRGCVEFEEWLITQQESTREVALQSFRALVQAYLARGEHRFGIQYAKRLLAIDPLSEEAHQQLMRLYTMAGRRNRALAQYEQLFNLLRAELGVDPVEMTTELYRSILLQGEDSEAGPGQEESSPPIIPLIGRSHYFEQLEESWNEVLEGRGRFTLVAGESGIGKSRLVKSFIDRASSKRDSVVLRGRSYSSAPVIGFRPIAEAVRAAFTDVVADEAEGAQKLRSEVLADLALVYPQLPKLVAGTLRLTIDTDLGEPTRVADSFLELLDILLRTPQNDDRPVIFLIEDLQWADAGSLDLLETIARNLATRSIWLVATSTDSEAAAAVRAAAGDSAVAMALERLSVEDVEEIAKSLVDLAVAPALADYLWRIGQGLPLAIAELVNLLWDEKILIQAAPGRWALRAELETLQPPEGIDELIHRRFEAMPNSARRLLALAAVLGHQFDVEVLTRAADEHLGVVEIAVQLSLERWLIRQFPQSWSHAGPERDIVLWARGVRRGYFEFSHRAIRASILARINPLRKRIMHAEAARALALSAGEETDSLSEDLAFHWLEAGEPEEALPWLETSARKADQSGSEAVAGYYSAKAATVRQRLAKSSSGSGRVVKIRRKAPPDS